MSDPLARILDPTADPAALVCIECGYDLALATGICTGCGADPMGYYDDFDDELFGANGRLTPPP